MHAQQHGRRTLGRWNLARHGLGSEYPAQEVEGIATSRARSRLSCGISAGTLSTTG
jgi:hypothetical protein